MACREVIIICDSGGLLYECRGVLSAEVLMPETGIRWIVQASFPGSLSLDTFHPNKYMSTSPIIFLALRIFTFPPPRNRTTLHLFLFLIFFFEP